MTSQTKEELDRKLDGNTARPVAPPHDIAQAHPKQQEAMKVFERFQTNRRMGMSIDIAGIAGQLTAPSEVRSAFPEELFLAHFLPLFADEVPPTAELNIRTWIDKVAGSETAPVDIINVEGAVLFTVPPVFDMSILDQARPGGLSMTRVERHYSRLKEVDAMASQTFLSKTLQSMHIKDKPTSEVYSNIRAWNAIFERYGKQDKIINLLNLDNDPNKDNPVVGAGPSVSDNDVADYELDTD